MIFKFTTKETPCTLEKNFQSLKKELKSWFRKNTGQAIKIQNKIKNAIDRIELDIKIIKSLESKWQNHLLEIYAKTFDIAEVLMEQLRLENKK